MSLLADPTICPDCRGPLDAAATCTGCGLPLTGERGDRLWQTMLFADRLVEEIRAAMPMPAPAVSRPPAAGLPPAPPAPSPRKRRSLPAFSVPVVLLSLGALCLLVAAVVFVAITWGSLGLTGRTLVLAGVTGLFAGAATLVTRRGLRGAGETLWTIVAGMLTLDLLAGAEAGLLGLDDLGGRALTAVVGSSLFLMGVGIALWARRTPVTKLAAPQVVAGLGAFLGAIAGGAFATNLALDAALVTPVLVALALALRSRLSGVAHTLLALAAISWLELAAVGVGRATEVADWSAWWADLRGWPLVVASAYAAAAGLAPRVPHLARTFLAAATLAPLAVLANAPSTTGLETRDAMVRAVTLAALAALVALTPRAWALAASALAGIGALAVTLHMTIQPLSVLPQLPRRASGGSLLPPVDSAVAAWAWPVVALAVSLVLVAAIRLLPDVLEDVAAAAAISVLGGGLVVAVLATSPSVWVGVAAILAIAGALAAGMWWRRHAWTEVAVGLGCAASGAIALLALALARPADSVTAVVATVIALALAAVFADGVRRHEIVGPVLTGGLAVLAGTYALPAWTTVLSVGPRTTALILAGFAAVVLLAAAPASRRTTSRAGLELTAAVPAASAVVLVPGLAALAEVLTVIGAALAALAVLNADRRHVSWLGAAVLGGATLVRVELDVQAPELYTLPVALLLLAAGSWRLRTDRDTDSLDALGSGLALALVPSLLLALQDPLTLRGVLVGAAGVAVLAVGVQQRLWAPLVAGAGTVALLAVRELEPIADAVPRWVSLGLVGAILLAVGITWEARLRNLRSAGRYLAALR